MLKPLQFVTTQLIVFESLKSHLEFKLSVVNTQSIKLQLSKLQPLNAVPLNVQFLKVQPTKDDMLNKPQYQSRLEKVQSLNSESI